MENGTSNEIQDHFLNDFEYMMNHEMMSAFDTTNVTNLIDTYKTFPNESENDARDIIRVANRTGESFLFVYKLLI